MRVVVDTNVVVSAILRDRLPERVILFTWLQGYASAGRPCAGGPELVC